MSSRLVNRNCPVCGTSYQADPARLKHGRQTTCSRKCSYARRAEILSDSETKPCAVCETPVTRTPSQERLSKTDAFLCSRACHYKARGSGIVGRVVTKPYEVPLHVRQASSERRRKMNAQRKAEGRYTVSAETRPKLSLATSKAIAEGRVPRVSHLEKEVGKMLNSLGIDNMPQHRIRNPDGTFGAVIDFFVPSKNIAVEVNGTFWHADPRIYPNGPEYPSQIRTACRYERKCALLKARNIELVEVWEIDFRTDPNEAVRKALGIG